MKKIFTICSLLMVSIVATAASDDVRTKPDLYYLTIDQVVDSQKLLPPPPSLDSMAFQNDVLQYHKFKTLRNTPRGKQAFLDAQVDANGVANAFSEAFGYEISAKNTPEIYKLTHKMIEDAGDLATRSSKQHYMRIRPYAYFNEKTCKEEDEGTLSTNGSYPSGHTSIGWATALILAEINPERQSEIVNRGFQIGQSRVICGFHWQSDVDAARVVASVVVQTLHTNPEFIAQLAKAKEEFKHLNKK